MNELYIINTEDNTLEFQKAQYNTILNIQQ